MWSAQAEAEGLTLLVAENKTGFFGVRINNPGKIKPYQARVQRGGKEVYLGSFATAEEAALCVARTPEGQAAAMRAPVQLHVASGDDCGDDAWEDVEVDAVEVDAWADDDDEVDYEVLVLEAEEVTLAVEAGAPSTSAPASISTCGALLNMCRPSTSAAPAKVAPPCRGKAAIAVRKSPPGG